jgi:hypothetical protein
MARFDSLSSAIIITPLPFEFADNAAAAAWAAAAAADDGDEDDETSTLVFRSLFCAFRRRASASDVAI